MNTPTRLASNVAARRGERVIEVGIDLLEVRHDGAAEGGHAVEAGTQEEVFGNPQRPETRAFMQSFHDEEPEDPTADNNGADPKLNVSTGTRGNLGQEE